MASQTVPEDFVRAFMASRHFFAARNIDIVARKDGKEYRLEGDWLKPFIASINQPSPDDHLRDDLVELRQYAVFLEGRNWWQRLLNTGVAS